MHVLLQDVAFQDNACICVKSLISVWFCPFCEDFVWLAMHHNNKFTTMNRFKSWNVLQSIEIVQHIHANQIGIISYLCFT